MDTVLYTEEAFGVLTDDGLYLDCTLVKPPGLTDAALRGLRVWVPKFPLTKSSVITCARQEVTAAGRNSKVAHLVFDLRGSGDSDFKDDNFDMDLESIRLWAEERFGKVSLGFLGLPTVTGGQVDLLPLRPGVFMEQYVYPARGLPTHRTVVFLASYGYFTARDEKLCQAMAEAGWHVHAIDPLRYLLHACSRERLLPERLWEDFSRFCQSLLGQPILVAQPIAAGLALVWAAGVEMTEGVMAIGRAQIGFRPSHIFQNDNPHTFFVSRYVNRIAPRPLALVQTSQGRRQEEEELAMLYQMSGQPRRLERPEEVDGPFLVGLLPWLENAGNS